jgi:hypothetical protein
MMHDAPQIGSAVSAAPVRANGAKVVYRRDLPGGGYVMIEVLCRDDDVATTRIIAERRSNIARRIGHEPPVVAEAVGDERSTGFGALYRLASDNAAVARALIELRRGRVTRAD